MQNPSPIGATLQLKGGLARGGLAYADAVAARAVQVFVGNPRGWKLSAGDPGQDALFTAGCAERGIPSFIHTPYLVNVGSPTEATVDQSIASIAHNLARGVQLGCSGVITHGGSAVGEARYETALRQLRERLLPVLDAADPDGPRLLIEPTAGGGKALAATVEDLGPYFDALDFHPLVGVCFDTCHAWAAGHDFSVPGGMTATLDTLAAVVGPGRLGLAHANDSLDACGSKRDRHTNVGEGSIGVEPFRELLAHPSMAGVPVVIETPSERDGSPTAGHERDIALLCSLRDGAEARSAA